MTKYRVHNIDVTTNRHILYITYHIDVTTNTDMTKWIDPTINGQRIGYILFVARPPKEPRQGQLW